MKIAKKEFNRIVELAVQLYYANKRLKDTDKLNAQSQKSPYPIDYSAETRNAFDDANSAYDEAYIAAYKKYSKINDSPENAATEACNAALDACRAVRVDNIELFREKFIERLNSDFDRHIIIEIDEHIASLKAGWNPFKRSAEAKIKSLEELKTDLLNNTGVTVSVVIEQWHNTHKDVIAQPRNILKSKKQSEMDTDLSTARFIKDLHENYGSESQEKMITRYEKHKYSQPFIDYIDSRTSWFQKIITFFFRNRELSAEKIELATGIVEEIQESRGQLKELLIQKQGMHTALSRSHGKNHYNLVEPREALVPVEITRYYYHHGESYNPGYFSNENLSTCQYNSMGQKGHPYTTTELMKDVRENEIENSSDLAVAFHEALRP